MRLFLWLFVFLVLLASDSMEGFATEQQTEEEVDLGSYDFSDIESFIHKNSGTTGVSLSFTELVRSLLKGDLEDVKEQILGSIKGVLFAETKSNAHLLLQVVVLGLFGAMFTNFSSIFTSSQISETGFFVTYLLLFTFLSASIFSSIGMAKEVLEANLEFMRVLLPSFFMAVAFSGGSVSALAMYEGTLWVIHMVEWVFCYFLIPLVRIYMLFVLAGHLAKEDLLSKLTDLIQNVIQWSMKTLVGIVLGLHLIQGMVLPYVDSVKTASLQKFIEVIPGIGQGASAVTKLMLGSGILIKNTMGAAFIIFIAVLTVIPVLKLALLMVLYQCVAAVIQPVCDKRILSCIMAASKGHKMLLQMVLAVVALFVVTIAVVCGASNVMYYAG